MKELRQRILGLPAPDWEGIPATELYSKHGFNVKDAEAIARNWLDLELEMEDDKIAEAAQFHSWCILARLGGKEGREFLIEELEVSTSIDDEVFLQAFPDLMLASGAEAVLELIEALQDEANDERILVEIVAALAGFAREGIERDTVLAAMVRLLGGDPRHRAVKGFIVNDLIDLSGDRFFEEIRKAFEEGLVDVSINGDLEEVEIRLGRRDERSTPKSDWISLETELAEQAQREHLGPPPEAGDDAATLNYFLKLYGGTDSVRSLAELDGLILGAVLAPEMVKPSLLLLAIWDSESLDVTPEWQSMEEAQGFMTAVMNWQNRVIRALDGNSYQPSAKSRSEPRSPTEEEVDWGRGVLKSVMFWSRTKAEPSEFHQAFMASALHLIQPSGDTPDSDLIQLEMMGQMACNLRAAIQSGGIPSFAGGYSGTYERDEVKIGRNDPCPCGSGQKYKRCCMN